MHAYPQSPRNMGMRITVTAAILWAVWKVDDDLQRRFLAKDWSMTVFQTENTCCDEITVMRIRRLKIKEAEHCPNYNFALFT